MTTTSLPDDLPTYLFVMPPKNKRKCQVSLVATEASERLSPPTGGSDIPKECTKCQLKEQAFIKSYQPAGKTLKEVQGALHHHVFFAALV
jgi:hypothetical protein